MQSPEGPVASVIIPAHNEQVVIERCLRALLDGHPDHELDIVVAANGCTDDTESIATAMGVRVVSTAEASKWGALNLGDAAAQTFPRMYVDADVEVSPGSIVSLSKKMSSTGAAIGAPTLRFPDFADAGRVVRRFYDGWQLSPYFDDKLVGFGFYAISETGRRRFERFPETMAEDYFLHRLFGEEERVVDDDHWFTPLLPTRLGDIVGVQARQLAANASLDAVADTVGHDLPAHHQRATWVVAAARSPRHWSALAVFLAVRVVATAVSIWKRRFAANAWTRDRSTHGPSASPPVNGAPD